jgi:hypothetical protein
MLRIRRRFVVMAALLAIGASPVGRQANGEGPSFVMHEIDTGLTGGYQVVVADLNHDGRSDILVVASGLHELFWYENPTWRKHVIATGLNGLINAAVSDIDGDGIPEIALAHEFSNVYSRSIGIVSLLTHQPDPTALWSIKEIDRVPTSHRVRFVDIGSAQRVLVNFPLIGAHAIAPDYRDRVSLFWYRPEDWKRQVVTDVEEGVVHGIIPTAWDGHGEAILSASFLGIHLLKFESGHWTRTRLTSGDPTAWPRSGSSDVAVGHLGRERFLAAIEPWHGNNVVTYRERSGTWIRREIDASIADGHTILAADLDGDGLDEIIVGERAGRHSVYVYRTSGASGDQWSKSALDDGGMAAAGCALADVNADRRPDIVCIGTATANLRWYENTSTRAR